MAVDFTYMFMENTTHTTYGGYHDFNWTTGLLTSHMTSRSTPTLPGMLSAALVDVVLTLNLSVLVQVLSVLGVVGNVISLLVFNSHGYGDSVSITLTALTASDIGALVTGQLHCLMASPWFAKTDLPIIHLDLAYILLFYPHNYFIRVCGFITAFASFERCICVLLPLKVKKIITPKFTICFITIIYSITLLDLFPVIYVDYLDWVFFPKLNTSKLGLKSRQNPYNVFGISYIITDLIVPYATFLVIIVCTAIVAVKLRQSAEWRQSLTKTRQNVPIREKKIIRMLMAVSVIFIVCLIPQSALLTVLGFVPEIGIKGSRLDITTICMSLAFLLEAISSSLNFIVFYKMSSKYRDTFNSLVCKRRTQIRNENSNSVR